MSTVILCEKPSQGKAIRAAIGDKMGKVVPMSGHILELKEPEDVRDDWKKWNTDLLWPGQFYDLKVASDKRSTFETVKRELAGASRVIVASDCDREGQLLADEVLRFVKFKGEVLRAIFNAEDPKTLQAAFANLKPNKDFENLYFAGLARQQADQVSNLTLTRTATVCFKAAGAKGAIGIGRVKTPVMSLICQREDERINFKPQTYFEIKAKTQAGGGSLDLTCRGLPKSLIAANAKEEGEDAPEEEVEAALAELEPLAGKIMTKDLADTLANSVNGSAPKLMMTSKKQSTPPPKLFELASLQVAASSRYGFTAARTLEIAQSLYETYKVTTYPRSEAEHLPEEEIGNAQVLANALLSCAAYQGYADLIGTPTIRKGKGKTFSDRDLEGMSHYAIVPNASVAKDIPQIVASLPNDEARLFDLIARRYMSALAPDYEYQKTDIWFFHAHPGPNGGPNHDWKFSTAGSIPLVQGWKEIAGAAGEGTDLPPVKNGEVGKVVKTDLVTKTTSPRPRFTEGSLILAMKNPWHFVDADKADLKAMLKEAEGIGRPSTRDKVAPGLIKQGLVTMQKKEFVPTPGGMALWKILRRVSPGLTDVVRTAVWEGLFKKVNLGKMTAEQAVMRIIEETTKERDNLVAASQNQTDRIGTAAPPSPKAVQFAQKLAEMKGLTLDSKRLKDRQYVYDFLTEHSPKEGEAFPPTPKQLALAESLSQRIGKPIPPEARGDVKLMRDWIDGAMAAAPPLPPSEKALSFARTIAERLGVPLPEGAETSAKICSEFINSQKDAGSGAGLSSGMPPSDKALSFAESIAESKGIPLPDAARTSAKACSEFINAHKGGGGTGKGPAKKGGTKSTAKSGSKRR